MQIEIIRNAHDEEKFAVWKQEILTQDLYISTLKE